MNKHYKQVHYHPQKSTQLDTVSSALHCVCCFNHISWKEAFRQLIHNGAKIGTMLQDRRSIRATLSEMGFFLQAGVYVDERSVKKMIIEEFEERFQDGEEVIVNLVDTPIHGFYLPIVPVK